MFSKAFGGKTAPKEDEQEAEEGFDNGEMFEEQEDYFGDNDLGSLDTKELKMLQQEMEEQELREQEEEHRGGGGFGFSLFKKKEEVYIEVRSLHIVSTNA